MTLKFDAVLFDCDGVLVDSEPITNGVLRDMLEEQGWKLSADECMRLFIGKAVKDEAALIEVNTGQAVTEHWMQRFRERRNEGLVARVTPIRGAVGAAAAIHALYQGRIFSGHEMPRSKPAPDVYLAAAAALGVGPRRCAVVEDTVTGVMAGVAAGATVFGYSPAEAGHDAPAALRQAGASLIFTDMAGLPDML